jgi:hypothetical protein
LFANEISAAFFLLKFAGTTNALSWQSQAKASLGG